MRLLWLSSIVELFALWQEQGRRLAFTESPAAFNNEYFQEARAERGEQTCTDRLSHKLPALRASCPCLGGPPLGAAAEDAEAQNALQG